MPATRPQAPESQHAEWPFAPLAPPAPQSAAQAMEVEAEAQLATRPAPPHAPSAGDTGAEPRARERTLAPPRVKPTGAAPLPSIDDVIWQQTRDIEAEAGERVRGELHHPPTPTTSAPRAAPSTPTRPPTRRASQTNDKMDITVNMLKEQRLDTQKGLDGVRHHIGEIVDWMDKRDEEVNAKLQHNFERVDNTKADLTKRIDSVATNTGGKYKVLEHRLAHAEQRLHNGMAAQRRHPQQARILGQGASS